MLVRNNAAWEKCAILNAYFGVFLCLSASHWAPKIILSYYNWSFDIKQFYLDAIFPMKIDVSF